MIIWVPNDEESSRINLEFTQYNSRIVSISLFLPRIEELHGAPLFQMMTYNGYVRIIEPAPVVFRLA